MVGVWGGEKNKSSLKYKYSSRALGQHKLGICNPKKALHFSVQSINKKECKSLYIASIIFSTAYRTTQEDKYVHLTVLVFSDSESSSLVFLCFEFSLH